jgi:ketosteroid isomerase-like protein
MLNLSRSLTLVAEGCIMPTPREIFALLARDWLSNANASAFPRDLLDDDVVIEMPLAPPGWPNRIQGRQQFVALAEAGRKAMPIRFDDCRNVVIHETADPEGIVVEYELVGTVTTTSTPASAQVIAVLRIQDGRIAHWREYHNIAAMVQ